MLHFTKQTSWLKTILADLLKQHLNTSSRQLNLGQGCLFQMDNDPKNTFKLVVKWLKVNKSPGLSQTETFFSFFYFWRMTFHLPTELRRLASCVHKDGRLAKFTVGIRLLNVYMFENFVVTAAVLCNSLAMSLHRASVLLCSGKCECSKWWETFTAPTCKLWGN